MKTAVIMSDAAGYPNRAAVLRRTCEAASVVFAYVSPQDAQQPDSWVTRLPDNWLPTTPNLTSARKEWFRNHLHYVKAIKEMRIEADFYWCVEADVRASPVAWLRLFEDTADRTEDGMWTSLAHRADSPKNGWFTKHTTPIDADWYCLGALFRISRRAVEWLFAAAEESRNVFTEIHVPSEIVRQGGNIGKIQRQGSRLLYNCQTMKFTKTVDGYTYPPTQGRNMFMHPVKRDDEISLENPQPA